MKSLVASSCNNSCGYGQEQWFSSLLYATCRRPSGNSSRGREMTAALQGPVRSFFRRVSKAACPFPFWHVSCHVISCVWTPSKLRMARIGIGWENILCYSIWKYVILVTSDVGFVVLQWYLLEETTVGLQPGRCVGEGELAHQVKG